MFWNLGKRVTHERIFSLKKGSSLDMGFEKRVVA